MVQWTPNRDQVLLKVILQIHNVKMDWKELELQMRREGIDVTQKGLMHRITKIKNTYTERVQDGKVNPILHAQRAADGKPKVVLPDTKPKDLTVDLSDGELPAAKKTKTGNEGSSSNDTPEKPKRTRLPRKFMGTYTIPEELREESEQSDDEAEASGSDEMEFDPEI